jgi:rhamnulokinase
VPPDRPALVRCILDSLAAAYARAVEDAVRLSGRAVDVVHVVGGGARNSLVCRLTAEATRRPVVAGPVEATALGNVMVQAYARGYVGSLGEIREVVRSSIEVQTYAPEGGADEWDGAFERFSKLMDTSLEGVVT